MASISSGDFKILLQKSRYIFEKNILEKMINQPRKIGWLSITIPTNSSTLEWKYRNQIENIISIISRS